MSERIEDPADPRVAAYRGVSDADLLRSSGSFVAEGRLIVRRVIEDGRYAVRSVLVNEAALRALEPTFARLAAGTPVYVCAGPGFLGITGHDIHRGCLALVRRPAPAPVEMVLASGSIGPRTIVVLDGVTNADNVGGVFRNAAAFGADAVLLSPTCCDPLYRKAIRTSMGAALDVPFAWVVQWPGGLASIRAVGFTLVALTPRQPSEALDAFAARRSADEGPQRLALLVGTEGSGLTPAVEAAADRRVRIPVRPGVDSLNLAVAAGIALQRLSNLGT